MRDQYEHARIECVSLEDFTDVCANLANRGVCFEACTSLLIVYVHLTED